MASIYARVFITVSERVQYGEDRRLQPGGLPVSLPVRGIVTVALTVTRLRERSQFAFPKES